MPQQGPTSGHRQAGSRQRRRRARPPLRPSRPRPPSVLGDGAWGPRPPQPPLQPAVPQQAPPTSPRHHPHLHVRPHLPRSVRPRAASRRPRIRSRPRLPGCSPRCRPPRGRQRAQRRALPSRRRRRSLRHRPGPVRIRTGLSVPRLPYRWRRSRLRRPSKRSPRSGAGCGCHGADGTRPRGGAEVPQRRPRCPSTSGRRPPPLYGKRRRLLRCGTRHRSRPRRNPNS